MLQRTIIQRVCPRKIETALSDGRAVCLRPIRPDDEDNIREGIEEMSDRSRYLRFFSAFREPPDSIVKRLSTVDGHNHIGWGAILLDGDECPPIAAAHAIRSAADTRKGELSIAVLDEYQGLGVARMLIAAVLSDCAKEDLTLLEMQIMGENSVAIRLIMALGAQRAPAVDMVGHYTLDVIDALAILRDSPQPAGVKAVLQALGDEFKREMVPR